MKKIFIIFSVLLSGAFSNMLFAENEEKSQDLKYFSDNTQFYYADQLFRLKEYDKALELFYEYLEIRPNGLHRKESFKNIASIYFENFDYTNSIKTYNSIYREFSNSEEGIEAYFMTGICYQKMGYLNKASEIFKFIISEHPESSFAPQAKIKVDLMEILEEN